VRRLFHVLSVALAGAALAIACDKSVPNLLVVPYMEAGSDAAVLPEAAPEDASEDAAPDANLNLGMACTDDAQCNENVPCEYFSCDLTYKRCSYIPDDSQCQNGDYCDGQEQCVVHHGCVAGTPVTCDDGNPCTIDHCDEATMACVRVPRDADQDGDPDDHCYPHHDCNDMNPNVSSKHAEVCGNHVDDNCNGIIDEMPCVVVQGGSCDTAVPLSGAGTYALSTVGADPTFSTSCTVSTPAGSENIVANVTVPPGPNVDLDVWASTPETEVALAIDGTCGEASSELTCNAAPQAIMMHARALDVAPGTYSIVVTTAAPTDVQLTVSFLTPTPAPTNDTCTTALPITPGTPTAVTIIDPPTDLVSACPGETGLLTYAFTLTQAADVRIYSTVVEGAGAPIVGIRDPACTAPTDEIACTLQGNLPLFVRDQPPGTYVVTVSATAPIDVSLLVQTSAATMAPADETCTAPPPMMLDVQMPVDLTSNTDAIHDGCFPGGVNAAFDLPITAPSDVLLVARFPQTSDYGAVSLDGTACTPASELACSVSSTPARVSKRNVPAADYRAVISDNDGEQDTFFAVVRPTVPPTIVTGDVTCASAVPIPATGGFFTGDTSTSLPNYEESCDAPGQTPGGAPDQTLVLTLTQPQEVIFDMEGSSYQTLLDIYQGSPCPGVEVPAACYVGFNSQRSFLDLELDAGQY
jgi:hypothetical protein